MSYRTMMVFLNDEEQAPSLLRVATELARQHSAHLIGLYVKPPLQIYVHAEVGVYLTDDHHAFHEKQSKQIQELFRNMTEKEEFAAEWRYIASESASTPDAVTEVARTVDLLIVSQKNPEETNPALREATEQILMSANRPVVIVPQGQDFRSIGSKVFVAWDGGPTATRAVFDSLPVLKEAESINLHRINPPRRDRHRILGASAEMVKTLSRHSLNVELIESDAQTNEIGKELLSYTQEQGADLLVMGAYGHSRFREFLFGGVTRYVLDNLTLPVLMSH